MKKIRYLELPVQVRATAAFVFCAFMQRGTKAIVTPILSRLFSTAEYGQYSVFYSWLDIVSVFVSLNLSSGVYTQGLIKFEARRKIFASSLQGLSTTLAVLWGLVYFCSRDFWNRLLSLSTVQMSAMLLMIWSTSAFMFWYEEQRANYNYRNLVLVILLVSVLSPVVGILCVVNAENKVTAWILGTLIVNLLVYIGPHLIQMYNGKQFYSCEFWKYALVFNIPLIPHYLSQTILNSSDRIMIERMAGQSEAGIYSLACSIAHIMTLFSAALNQTIGPWLYKKIRDKKVADIYRIAYPAIILIATMNTILIAFAPEILFIFAPGTYYDALWVIPPVAMSVNFLFTYIFFANFEFYFEKTNCIAIATIGGAVLNIILNYIFINLFGYLAAGYTTLFCYFLYVIFHYFSMRRVCKLYLDNARVYDPRVLLGITILFVMMGFLLMLTYKYTLMRYIIIVVIFGCFIVKRKYLFNMIAQIINVKKQM